MWRLVGLITSLGLGLIASNVDLLWCATIRRTFDVDQYYRRPPRRPGSAGEKGFVP